MYIYCIYISLIRVNIYNIALINEIHAGQEKCFIIIILQQPIHSAGMPPPTPTPVLQLNKLSSLNWSFNNSKVYIWQEKALMGSQRPVTKKTPYIWQNQNLHGFPGLSKTPSKLLNTLPNKDFAYWTLLDVSYRFFAGSQILKLSTFRQIGSLIPSANDLCSNYIQLL